MYKYYIGEALLIIDLSEAKEPVDKIVEKVQKVVSGDVTSGDQGTMRPLTIEEERKIKKKIIYNVHSEKISEKRFDDFWNAYPRKQGGKKALREKWAKRNLDAIADQIIAHVEAMKQNDWLGKEEEYIPMASTYLNQDRWEDEILRRETHETDRRNSQLTRRQASVQSHLDFLESLDPCSGESFIKH